jgi:hypothetical protein
MAEFFAQGEVKEANEMATLARRQRAVFKQY